MSICPSRRDPTDRPEAVLSQIAVGATYLPLSLALLVWLAWHPDQLRAQPAFAPPPLPQPSGVRGIYDPAVPPPSPAKVAPQPKPTSPADTPTSSKAVTSTAGAQPLEGGEIIARVDGQIVLASDVLWQVNQIIEANRDRIPPEELETVRRNLLRQQAMGLIDTKLLYADFRRNVPVDNIPRIEENLVKPFEEQEVPRLIKVLEVKDRRELIDLLEGFGSSLADVQRQFNERTIAGEWLRQKAPKPKPVTHEQMLEYYQEHLREYEFPAEVRWEELMVRFDRYQGDRAAAWRAISELGNEVWQRVSTNPQLRGAVFTEIAPRKSHGFSAEKGGQHEWTTRGAMRNEKIDEALFSLQVGQLSNVIEGDSGFHIIRVLERKDAGCTPFSRAQADIRKKLQGERRKGIVEAELEKLRRQSRVWTVFSGDLSGPRLAEMLQERPRR